MPPQRFPHQVDVLPFPGEIKKDGAAQFDEQRTDHNSGNKGDDGPQIVFIKQIRQQHAVPQGKTLACHHGYEVGERHDAESANLDKGKREHFSQRGKSMGKIHGVQTGDAYCAGAGEQGIRKTECNTRICGIRQQKQSGACQDDHSQRSYKLHGGGHKRPAFFLLAHQPFKNPGQGHQRGDGNQPGRNHQAGKLREPHVSRFLLFPGNQEKNHEAADDLENQEPQGRAVDFLPEIGTQNARQVAQRGNGCNQPRPLMFRPRQGPPQLPDHRPQKNGNADGCKFGESRACSGHEWKCLMRTLPPGHGKKSS